MIEEENKTIWCGNLADQVTEEILYELFLQAGPLEKVKIPRDRDGRLRGFAFITYCHEVSVPYALNLFRGTALFHRTLSLQARGKLALLPPPIRCHGPDNSLDFVGQGNVAKQFSEMTEKFKEENPQPVHLPTQRHYLFDDITQSHRPDSSDKLVMASLQGNWSHRHHPYRSKDKSHNRDDYRHRDDGHKSQGNSNNWRSRRDNWNRRRK
ncbi:RNA-binding protein 7 [Melitaea cinxia]|uniref:RNA-binding protein 7 n=1 Tax=Melitaea cinxia TaxID=113334 RepID=UPI001E273E8C|nr:RNA-binding protein 7 [Melitaea cinxia]